MEKSNGKKSLKGYFFAVFSVVAVFMVCIGGNVKANAAKVDEYEWSSYQDRLDEERESLLDRGYVIELFGSRSGFVRFHEADDGGEHHLDIPTKHCHAFKLTEPEALDELLGLLQPLMARAATAPVAAVPARKPRRVSLGCSIGLLLLVCREILPDCGAIPYATAITRYYG